MKSNNTTVKVLFDELSIFKCQVIERKLFNLDLFNTKTTVFPHQVFNRHFDSYRFMIFNDWFHAADDYNSLITFLNLIGERTFYASCPPPFLINPIAFTSKTTQKEFQKAIRYGQDKVHYSKDILTSPETFYYGESEKWAIVLDITNNLIIVGLESATVAAFESSFKEKFFDVEGVADWLLDLFRRFHKLHPKLPYKITDEQENTLTQIKHNYGNERI